MKYIQVLFIVGRQGRVIEVVLRDPETHFLLREDYDTFMYRAVLPHNTRLEIRKIDSFVAFGRELFGFLPKDEPVKNTSNVEESFVDLFLAGTGYYSPKNPVAFPCNERITHAAVIFPFVDAEGKTFKTVMQTGVRHSDCFDKQFASDSHYFKGGISEGFWTDKQRFIDRYEAKKLALANGQLTEDTEYAELYSEDLW